MISIVTGTLNRLNLLPSIIDNTVNSNKLLELVLVDGGSSDGTIEYIKKLNHPQITLVEVGKRSSYPHFMNLGIKNSKYEYVCQWNDDVLLINSWDEVIYEIDDSDVYLFNWKYGNIEDKNNKLWLGGNTLRNGWCLGNTKDENGIGEIVMNYGIYNKKVFRNIGMYNNEYNYYYADGDMCDRAYCFDYKVKTLRDIKVLSIHTDKKATHHIEDKSIYDKNLNLHKSKILPKNIELL